MFSEQGKYGTAREEWIGSLGGVAYHDGKVFVFDHGRPEVVVLSEGAFEAVHRFGRRGEGPGEFAGPARPFPLGRYFDIGFLATAESGLAVYDGTGIELFDPRGTFKRRHVRGVPASRVFGFRYLGATQPAGQVLFAVDAVQRGANRQRALQTWAIVGDDPVKLWEVPLAYPPTAGRGLTMPSLQARPLWAVWGQCVVLSDGASNQLLRLDLANGVEDTLQLPDWSVRRSDADSGSRYESLPGSGAKPTAMIRWEDMVVDPSGSVWLRLWNSEPSGPARVAVISLHDGTVRDVTVPSFPRAFGASGAFFSVERGPFNEAFIVKYSVSSAPS